MQREPDHENVCLEHEGCRVEYNGLCPFCEYIKKVNKTLDTCLEV